MITKLSPTTLFLDEAGHVYVPLAGPGDSCLRLNTCGSALWRTWTSNGAIIATLAETEARFLRMLLERGALTAPCEQEPT